ncbi:hypothetical protein J4G02_01460 [Candidatus Poribacteria bacterium]|nr:hypothetical protein [Candidatus Poribacteria bacterium]
MKKLRLWAFTLLLLSPLLLPMRVSTAQLDMDDSAISGDLFDRISPPITDFFISAQQVSAGPPTKKSPRDFIGRIYAPKPEDWKVRSEAHPIIGVPNTPLPLPFAVAVRNLDDGFPLSGLPITFAVTAGGGTFSVPRALTDHTSIAETTLTLGPICRWN